jgi:hypothetical protein
MKGNGYGSALRVCWPTGRIKCSARQSNAAASMRCRSRRSLGLSLLSKALSLLVSQQTTQASQTRIRFFVPFWMPEPAARRLHLACGKAVELPGRPAVSRQQAFESAVHGQTRNSVFFKPAVSIRRLPRRSASASRSALLSSRTSSIWSRRSVEICRRLRIRASPD